MLLSMATTDEWEDICIVPVDEDISMAMGCADYQSLLISIGMQPPSDMVRDRFYPHTCEYPSCLVHGVGTLTKNCKITTLANVSYIRPSPN